MDNNKCGDDHNQSPIDLPKSGTMYDADDDNFQKIYSDIKNVQVKWVGDTSKIDTTGGGSLTQKFESEFVSDVFGGNDRFSGV